MQPSQPQTLQLQQEDERVKAVVQTPVPLTGYWMSGSPTQSGMSVVSAALRAVQTHRRAASGIESTSSPARTLPHGSPKVLEGRGEAGDDTCSSRVPTQENIADISQVNWARLKTALKAGEL